MLAEIIKKGKESTPTTRDKSTIREIKMVKENIAKMSICLLYFNCTVAVG